MLTLDAITQTALEAPWVPMVWLLELEFVGATHRFTTFNLPLQAMGVTWQAAGNLLSVPDLKESTEASAQPISVKLSVANQAVLALALGNVENYRGRPARLYLALLGSDHQVISTPKRRFSGYMEPVKIDRDKSGKPGGGSKGGAIELPLSRSGMARARNVEGQRLTHQQQQFAHPGDRGLEYMQALVQTPVPWISKAFQER